MDCVVVPLRLGRPDLEHVGDLTTLECRVVDLLRAQATQRGAFEPAQVSRRQLAAVVYLHVPAEFAARIDGRRGAYTRSAYISPSFDGIEPARRGRPNP